LIVATFTGPADGLALGVGCGTGDARDAFAIVTLGAPVGGTATIPFWSVNVTSNVACVSKLDAGMLCRSLVAIPISIGSGDARSSGMRRALVADVEVECAAPVHDRCAEMTRGVAVGAAVPVSIGGGVAEPPLQATEVAASAMAVARMYGRMK
jgi:hypothetical protein